MAVNNVFQVSNLVINDLLAQYANALNTTYLATPFDRFDNAPQVGESQRVTYPLLYKSINSLTYDPAFDINNTQDRYDTITLDIEVTVPIQISADEMTFYANAGSYDQMFKKFVNPMAFAGGNNVNRQVVKECELKWSDSIGDPTVGLNGIFTMTAVNAMFANMALENHQQKYMCVSNNTGAQLQQNYAKYFNEEFNGPILANNTNNLGDFSGVWVYRDNYAIQHQNGTWEAAGDITVSADPTPGNINDSSFTVPLAGFTAGATGNFGDLIYFQDATDATNVVEQLNPGAVTSGDLAVASFGNPKTFVLTTAFTTAGATQNVVLYPPMVTTGPYQNVSRAIVDTDVAVLVGGPSATFTKNMCFVRPALQFANPRIATYPLIPAKGKQLSAYPSEMTPQMKIPGTDLNIAFNLASQGDLSQFSNTLALRTIAGALAFNGYGFMFLSKSTGPAPAA